MKTLSQIKEGYDQTASCTDKEISESLVGKVAAIAANRQHAAHKTKLIGNLSQIQNDCRRAVLEDNETKRNDLLFQLLFDFATALKSFAEMSGNINNISTAAVLDYESVKKDVQIILSKLLKK